MKQKSKLKDVAKRVTAFTLGSVMAVTGAFTDFVLPRKIVNAEAAETVTEETVGTDIVNIAMKYLGYGYSQSSRDGSKGTFDCSGLVNKVLTEAGFSGVPNNTSDWQSQISSGTLSLSYNGQYKDTAGFNGIKYASSLEEMYQMKDDDANNGYAIITKTAVTTDRLQDADLPAGSIVVTQATANSAAHAMIVIGDYSDEMPKGVNSINFWKNYWGYYDNVIEAMASQYPNMNSRMSAARYVGTPSTYIGNTQNYTAAQIMDWPSGTAFTTKQPYWMMINSTAASSSTSSTLGSGTWIIDAASTTYGVRITNKIGGKGGATVPAYVIVWPENKEYFASVNFHKVNQNGSNISGAEFTAYSNEACTNKVATLDYSAGGKYSWTDQWDSSEGDNKRRTYFIKETKVPNGYTADIDSSGRVAMWKVELDGQFHTTTYYKRYGTSGSWTKVKDGAVNTYYLNVTNSQKEATVNLSVHKTDDAGKNIANVVFTIYENFNSSTGALSGVLGTITTNRNGEGTFSYELGTTMYSSKSMYIKETKVPDGYVISNDVVFLRPIVGYYQNATYYYGLNGAGYYAYNPDGSYTLKSSNIKEVLSMAGISEVVNYPESNPTMCAGSYELSMEVGNDRVTDFYAYKTVGTNTSLDNITSVTYQLYRTSSKYTAPVKVGAEKTSSNKSGAQKFRVDWTDLAYYDDAGNVYSYYAVETKVNGSAENLSSYKITYDGDDGYTVVTNTLNTLYGKFSLNKTDDIGNAVAATFNVYSSASCTDAVKLGSFTTTNGTGTYTLSSWKASEGATKTVYFKEANLDANGYVTIDGVKYKGDTNVYRVAVTGTTSASAASAYKIYNNATGEELTGNTVVNYETTSHSFEKKFGEGTESYIDSVTVQLMQGNTVYDEKIISKNSAGAISYTWSSLPKYDASGNAYKYWVKETAVNGRTDLLSRFTVTTNNAGTSVMTSTTITNTIKTVDHTFYKRFGNTDTQNAITSIKVQLYQNGAKYGNEVIVTAASKVGSTAWAYKWSGLPQYDKAGNAYKYYAQEVSVSYKAADGTSHTLTGSSIDTYFIRTTSNAGTQVLTSTTVTNTLIPLYGAVSIQKVNAENETVKIKGVKYGVYFDQECKNRIGDYLTTDASGVAVYTVAAPWYKINDATKTVYIREYSTVSPYILDNTIYKVVITGSAVNASGSSCTVTADGKDIGTSIKQFKQDNAEQYGQIIVSKYGEVLTGFSRTTLTGADGVITGYNNGTFSYTAQKMAGAAFKLYAVGNISNKAGTIIYTDGQELAALTTDANGMATFTGLPLGTYRIVETQAPEGQTLPEVHEWTKTLTYAGQTAAITSESQDVNDALADAAVSVVKIDSTTSYGLADTYFGLYAAKDIKNAAGTVIVKADELISVTKTDSEGHAVFLNSARKNMDIPYGSYYIKELQTRDGYTLSDEVYEFTFAFENQESYLKTFTHTFKDERINAHIEMQKIDKKTGLPIPSGDGSLEGAVYYLYAREPIVHPDGHTGNVYGADDYVATLTTDENGFAEISGLYPGKYYVKEITPPEGYLLDSTEYDLVVVSDGVNHAETTITQYKNTEVVNGAGFTAYLAGTLVYKEDGSVDYENSPKAIIGENGETELFTHDLYDENKNLLTSGYLKTIAVPYGKYLVHESTVPENMKQAQDFYVTIGVKDAAVFDQNGNPVENNKEPKKLNYVYDAAFEARIKIIKKDSATGNIAALAGTAFKIYDMDHQTYVVQTTIIDGKKVQTDTFVTNDEGYLITPETLHYGTYRIEEQMAPNGYYNSETAEGIVSNITITVGTGFVFEGSNVDEYYDADLNCYILPVVCYDDEVRGVIEVYKEGEVLDSYNEETKAFTWVKTGLAGAEYDVYAEGDIYTPDHQTDENGNRTVFYKNGELVGHITTGVDGHGYLKDLPLGNYKIVETKAPNGYLLGDAEKTAQYATLAYAGQNAKVVYDSDGTANNFFNERPQADISIVKYEKNEDGSTNYSVKLSGTTFDFITMADIKNYKGEVIVQAGTVLTSVTTGAEGVAAVDKTINIPFGSYAFIETAVTPGYVLDQTPIPISFAYADQYTEVISVQTEQANDFIKLDTSKLDIANSAEVEGAQLAVIRVNDDGTETIIDEWISTDVPHRINRIPAGDYILREISVPTQNGYVKAQDLPFAVTETAVIQEQVMYDDHTELHIKKTDLVTGEPVIGATLQLINADGSIYAEWITDGTDFLLEYIPVGTYTLREIIPADGYATAEDVTVEVREVGSRIEIQKAEMKDQPLMLRIKKTDFVSGEEVIGAILQLINADGSICLEWVTGDTKNPNIEIDEETGETYLLITRIPAGTYTLREIQAPDGFEIAGDVTVTVKDTEDIQTVEMIDYRTPEAETTARDAATGTHSMSYGKTVTLTDTVYYRYLIPGKEYTVTGTVMVKETGEPLTDAAGNIITATTTFIPDSKVDGSVELFFTIDTTLIPDTTLVVFENIEENGKTIIIHADIEDEDQTVYIPEIGTTFTNDTTNGHVAAYGEKVSLTDTVEYKNLIPGDTYTITGVIYSKETGEPLLDADGNQYTASRTFIPETAAGSVALAFTIDTTVLKGQTFVAFESLTTSNVEIAVEDDIDNEGQTVHVPEIGTTAKDTATDDHVGALGEKVTVRDTVKYKNLIPGQEYTVSGVLHAKSTGEPLLDAEGNPYTASKTFKAEKADGAVVIEFTVDTTVLKGETIVAFETLTHKGVEIAVEADIEDEGQSVHVPDIGTTATDVKTEDHIGSCGEAVTIQDVVAYTNLVPGKEYTISGVLYSRQTGEPITDADGNICTASKAFTPEEANGSVTIEFVINTTILKGQTLVVFETLTYKGVEIAVHADIEDEGQTVHIPEIGTTFTDCTTGTHDTLFQEKVTVQDAVEYTNLISGKEYVLTGTLYLKSTGEPLLDEEGNPYTATKTFIAESENGTETLAFTVDTTKIAGEKIVAFETLTYKGVEIAVEADIEDADQTIEVPKAGKIGVMKKGNVVTGTREVKTRYGTVNKLTFGYTYLAGVEFTVYADKECTEDVTKIVTNSDGLAVSKNLVAGTYYIVETYTPAGYAKDDTVYTVVIDGIAENIEGIEYVLDVTKDIVNHLCSSTLNIYKVGTDLEGSEKVIPLEGVYFGVYADEDIKNVLGDVVIKAGDCIAIIKTNSEGIATMTESLPSGKYYYKEIRTLDDFVLDETEYRFEVALENDDAVIEVNKTNPLINHAKSGTLTVHKVDQDNNPLGAGAEFLLTCVETGETWTLVTGADGVVSISNLPIGYIENGQWVYYTYTLRETKTLDNYRLDDTVYTFSFTAESTAADAVYKSFTVRNVILGIRDYSMAGGITMLLMAAVMSIMALKKRRAWSLGGAASKVKKQGGL